jgi:hypothetical protein
MKIGDYKQMMAYLTRPEQPKEQVADLVDDLTPGPLKDEFAIGGGAIEGEDLGTREGFQDPAKICYRIS